jgi:tol-pal system protein YbgF
MLDVHLLKGERVWRFYEFIKNEVIMHHRIIKNGGVTLGTLLLVGSLILLAGCALQKDLLITQSDLNQKLSTQKENINKIRTDLQVHWKEWEEKNKSFHATQAELRSLIHELREEVSNLRGQLEKSTYLAEMSVQKNAELDEMIQSVMKRVLHLEAYLAMEPTETMVLSEGIPDKSEKDRSEKKLTGDALYAAAKKLFDAGDYATAREQFQIFLKENPKSEKADNAQFWIAETYYHEKWYEKAILGYQEVIEKYSKGNKVASALLKQGLAFYNIDDKRNAELILKELIRKFPKSKEAQIAEKKLSRM